MRKIGLFGRASTLACWLDKERITWRFVALFCATQLLHCRQMDADSWPQFICIYARVCVICACKSGTSKATELMSRVLGTQRKWLLAHNIILKWIGFQYIEGCGFLDHVLYILSHACAVLWLYCYWSFTNLVRTKFEFHIFPVLFPTLQDRAFM